MNQPLVNLRVDFAFKQLFGSRGNEQILIQFLNVILASSLSSPIQTLKIEDPHLHREYEKDKLSILDVLGSVAKFLNRQSKPRLVCRIYAVLNSFCNSLYAENQSSVANFGFVYI